MDIIKDTTLRKLLFGRDNQLVEPTSRGATITFPGVGEEQNKYLHFRGDDGLILYMLEKIEKLELRLAGLEMERSYENCKTKTKVNDKKRGK